MSIRLYNISQYRNIAPIFPQYILNPASQPGKRLYVWLCVAKLAASSSIVGRTTVAAPVVAAVDFEIVAAGGGGGFGGDPNRESSLR